MSIALAVYLAGLFDAIRGIAILVAAISGVSTLIVKLVDLIDDPSLSDDEKKIRKGFLLAFLISLPIAIFTPSSEVIYIHTAEKVIESPVVQEEASDIYKDLKVIIHNLATKKDK